MANLLDGANLNGQRLVNLGTPTGPADAATRAYVDGVVTSAPIDFTWDGATYQPSALLARTDRVKHFVGPTDPSTVTGVTLGTYDEWSKVVLGALPYNGFGSSVGNLVPNVDISTYTLGTAFKTSRSGQYALGARFWVDGGRSQTEVNQLAGFRLYAADSGTGYPTGVALTAKNIAAGTYPAPTGGVGYWIELYFNSPYALTANTVYYITAYVIGKLYSSAGHTFDSQLAAPSGAAGLVFPADSAQTHNGVYNQGADAAPNSSVNATFYGVDVILAAGAAVASKADYGWSGTDWIVSSGGGSATAGAAGADGKTVRNGSGAPASGLGVDGDFYIDTTAHAIYGPKAGGSWGSATSLVGPQGPAGPPGKYTQILATSATSYTITHNLASTYVIVAVKDHATGAAVMVDWTVTDANTVTLSFAVAPSANAYDVCVVG